MFVVFFTFQDTLKNYKSEINYSYLVTGMLYFIAHMAMMKKHFRLCADSDLVSHCPHGYDEKNTWGYILIVILCLTAYMAMMKNKTL